ncbi:ParM/StbA family protein [Paenibacillus sp. MMO-58]|uniref:ParM/StbA family protein n=1 Tax=Paenibacillus sp. MMO-58 TaxID=3081290 RepID=UPI003016C76A
MAIKGKIQKSKFKQIDIGYGYLKFTDKDGKVRKEKAVVGVLGESLSPAESRDVDIIKVDGIEYIIGDAVYKLGRKPLTANENAGRAANIAYKVLAIYALAKTHTTGEKVEIVTGLPYQNLDESDDVKALLTNEHSIELNGEEIIISVSRTSVCSQGLGTYFTIIRQRGGEILTRKILIVDLGFRTINYMPVNAGDIQEEMVRTNRELGIQNAYRVIVNAINKEFKTAFKYYEVDELLDVGVPRQDLDKGLYYENIKERPYVTAAFEQYAKEVWADIIDKYDEGYLEDLSEVIFAGGTADRVKLQLGQARKVFCSFIEDSQDAQVLGYVDVAKKIEEAAEAAAALEE